jgi:hypothetical protein
MAYIRSGLLPIDDRASGLRPSWIDGAARAMLTFVCRDHLLFHGKPVKIVI